MEPRSVSSGGFTLIELLITLSVASFILIVLSQTFLSSQRSYNLQDQIMQMDQNAYFSIKKLTEVLEGAGAGLPVGAWDIIGVSGNPTDSFDIVVNPGGGRQVIRTAVSSSVNLPVDDGPSFSGTPLLKKVYLHHASAHEDLTIDTGYNETGWDAGIRVAGGDYDTVRLTAAESFAESDTVFTYATHTYSVSDSKLLKDGEILAENIDSLGVTFLEADQSLTTSWDDMLFIHICVRGITEIRDPNYEGDGYRRKTVTRNFRLKNKL